MFSHVCVGGRAGELQARRLALQPAKVRHIRVQAQRPPLNGATAHRHASYRVQNFREVPSATENITPASRRPAPAEVLRDCSQTRYGEVRRHWNGECHKPQAVVLVPLTPRVSNKKEEAVKGERQ